MQEFKIDAQTVGTRADVFLANHFTMYARSALAKLFSEEKVLLNNEPTKPGYKLRLHDQLSIDVGMLDAEPETINLPILYEDSDVVVIDKPTGVLSHSKGAFNKEGTVSSFVRVHANLDDQSNRTGIVHRLDRATSGVMVCAKNPEAQSWLQKQFAQRRVKKTYVAVVSGVPAEQEAIIDAPIERNPKKPQTFRVGSLGKTAQTHYSVLKSAGQRSLLELKPTTGRTHQLRVHLDYIGHPILGDELYNGLRAERLLLHASSLELTLPGRERRVFTSKVPKEFAEAVKEGHA